MRVLTADPTRWHVSILLSEFLQQCELGGCSWLASLLLFCCGDWGWCWSQRKSLKPEAAYCCQKQLELKKKKQWIFPFLSSFQYPAIASLWKTPYSEVIWLRYLGNTIFSVLAPEHEKDRKGTEKKMGKWMSYTLFHQIFGIIPIFYFLLYPGNKL